MSFINTKVKYYGLLLIIIIVACESLLITTFVEEIHYNNFLRESTAKYKMNIIEFVKNISINIAVIGENTEFFNMMANTLYKAMPRSNIKLLQDLKMAKDYDVIIVNTNNIGKEELKVLSSLLKEKPILLYGNHAGDVLFNKMLLEDIKEKRILLLPIQEYNRENKSLFTVDTNLGTIIGIKLLAIGDTSSKAYVPLVYVADKEITPKNIIDVLCEWLYHIVFNKDVMALPKSYKYSLSITVPSELEPIGAYYFDEVTLQDPYTGETGGYTKMIVKVWYCEPPAGSNVDGIWLVYVKQITYVPEDLVLPYMQTFLWRYWWVVDPDIIKIYAMEDIFDDQDFGDLAPTGVKTSAASIEASVDIGETDLSASLQFNAPVGAYTYETSFDVERGEAIWKWGADSAYFGNVVWSFEVAGVLVLKEGGTTPLYFRPTIIGRTALLLHDHAVMYEGEYTRLFAAWSSYAGPIGRGD